jgi:hypothetical protein
VLPSHITALLHKLPSLVLLFYHHITAVSPVAAAYYRRSRSPATVGANSRGGPSRSVQNRPAAMLVGEGGVLVLVPVGRLDRD